MSLTLKRIHEIPQDAYRRGPRDSVCLDAVAKLREDPTQVIAVDGGDQDERQRFYKAMIQWRSRHKELGLGIRKTPDTIYLFFTASQPT